MDEVLKLLQVMTGDRRYEEIFRKKKEGVHSMCDVAERLEQMALPRESRLAGVKEERRAKSRAKYWYIGICAEKVLMRKKPGDLRSCRKI